MLGCTAISFVFNAWFCFVYVQPQIMLPPLARMTSYHDARFCQNRSNSCTFARLEFTLVAIVLTCFREVHTSFNNRSSKCNTYRILSITVMVVEVFLTHQSPVSNGKIFRLRVEWQVGPWALGIVKGRGELGAGRGEGSSSHGRSCRSRNLSSDHLAGFMFSKSGAERGSRCSFGFGLSS